MKKILFLFVLLFNVLLLSSCVWKKEIYSEGFEHMYDGESVYFIYMGKTVFYNTFKKYNYIDGNYFYYDNVHDSEKILLYLKFEEEDYWKAKGELFENFDLLDEPIREYNDYVFYLNKDYIEYRNFSEIDDYGFPDVFNSYCYSDRTFTLMLVGYCSDDNKQERDLAKDEFGKFLESAFGNFYNFNQ